MFAKVLNHSWIGGVILCQLCNAQLSLVIQMDPAPSPYISDWRSKPNTVRFIVTNPTSQQFEVRFDGNIEGDRRGRVAETKLDASIPPVVVTPGTHTMNAIDANLLVEGAVRYIGPARDETARTGRLPDDHFRLCVRLVQYNAPNNPLTPEACTRFEIRLLQPPSLITPVNKTQSNLPVSFQWSVVPMGIGSFAHYELTLVQMDPGQTNPAVAMESNFPLLRKELKLPTYIYQASDPPLEKGVSYAWRVRAFDPEDKFTFTNGGRSEVWTFSVKAAMVFDGGREKKPDTTKRRIGTTREPFKDIQVITNTTLTGTLYYAFDRKSLLFEHKVGAQTPFILGQSTASLNPLANVNIRLVKKYKVQPGNDKPSYVVDESTGKIYYTRDKIIATTKTDGEGRFQFQFLNGEPSKVISDSKINYKMLHNITKDPGTLWKYYTVEVVNPYYCSSSTEIALEPGQTRNVNLTSLVRTYNLDVTVQDSEGGHGLADLAVVYLARYHKFLVPPGIPRDEGELDPEPDSQGIIKIPVGNPWALPTKKFSSNKWGYVISARASTTQEPAGHVLFTRLVRNIGPVDRYILSAQTPERKPEYGNPYNALYYFDAVKSNTVHVEMKYGTDAFDPQHDFSGEVVDNSAFIIQTFQAEVKMTPRLPRLFGYAKRKDNPDEMVKGAMAFLSKPGTSVVPGMWDFTDSTGYFVINDVPPTTSEWNYTFRIQAVGFKVYMKYPIAVEKGKQYNIGEPQLEPKMTVRRFVVDEWNSPIDSVEYRLGAGARKYTDRRGTVYTPAITGPQPFHLEKRPKYADKDTMVNIPNNPSGFDGETEQNKIVLFEAKRRLEIRVVNQQSSPIEGAVVTLLDKYTGPLYFFRGQRGDFSPYRRETNAQGKVSFAYFSPDSTARVSIMVPESDFVPREVEVSGIRENGKWKKYLVILQAGGRMKGVVYLGEKRQTKKTKFQEGIPLQPPPETVNEQDIIRNLPIANARVFIEGYPELTTYSNNLGEFQIRGIPPGFRKVKVSKAPTSVDSQYVGSWEQVYIQAGKTTTQNLFMTQYFGMDITKLLGFPIEIDDLDELEGGRLKISGAFVDVPSNSLFKPKNSDARFEFLNVELQRHEGNVTPPPARPTGDAVRILNVSLPLVTHNTFTAHLRNPAQIIVTPRNGDILQGQFNGKVELFLPFFDLSSNDLQLLDQNGNPTQFWLGLPPGSPEQPPKMTYAPLLSSGGTFEGGAVPRIASRDGNDVQFRLYAYNVTSTAAEARLESNGMHLPTVIRVTLVGCGMSKASTCDLSFDVGEVFIQKTGLQPINVSQIPAQDLLLQDWKFHAENFRIVASYLTFDGSIQVKVAEKPNKESVRWPFPYTDMQLKPVEGLEGGTFNYSELDMFGIARMSITSPFFFGSDSKGWLLTTQNPVVHADQGQGKTLEGLKPGSKLTLENFYLWSDGSRTMTTSSDAILVYDVSHFIATTMQFGWDTGPYWSMLGALQLIDIPELAYLPARIYYTQGGKFNMDPVKFQNFSAGGVKLDIAGGLLGPTGFKSEGTHGMYKNQIKLQGAFTLNIWFWHRKIGPNKFSTIAEVINTGHTPSQNQKLFGNPSGPDVQNVYGRTQLESNKLWSTNLAGWYQTQELAGRDSMYYTVVGTGGNGSVNQGNSTLKMKGTTGGIGMLHGPDMGRFPKGPPPPWSIDAEEEEEESPFSDLTITIDFLNFSIRGSVHVKKEISPGTGFEGDLSMTISFGPNKFWSFLAAGTGQVASPPCQGSAVFLAGLNYNVSAEDKQLVYDYSISKRQLPPEFHKMTGFFTQVAVVMPIPGMPNFSLNFGPGMLTVECKMGGEARVGLNFAQGTTFYIGIYCMAQIKVECEVDVFLVLVGVKIHALALVKVEIGASFAYNNDAGASFNMFGSIYGGLSFDLCFWAVGWEECLSMTLFELGGKIDAQVGNNEYLDIEPTFSFLGFGRE